MKLIEYELNRLGYIRHKKEFVRNVDHHSITEEYDRIKFHFSIHRFIFYFFIFIMNDRYILKPKSALRRRG